MCVCVHVPHFASAMMSAAVGHDVIAGIGRRLTRCLCVSQCRPDGSSNTFLFASVFSYKAKMKVEEKESKSISIL